MQSIYDVLSFVGIPSLIGLIWAFLFNKIIQKKQVNNQDTKAIKEGIQVLLKEKLQEKYDNALSKGYATIHEKDNFEVMYKRYHVLGENGVMDNVRDDYMNFPTEPPTK